MTSLVPLNTPDGWVLEGAPRDFTGNTLFEHINGQAELFFQYGFERSIYGVYTNKKSIGEKIDLDIYDMGSVVHAFGVFSRFRQEGRSAGIGLGSYLDDDYALFYKDRYFVVLQATGPFASGLTQLAGMIASRINDGSPPPKEIAYFPKRGLKPDSIEYYAQGLMGRAFLRRGFKATYVMPDKTGAEPQRTAEPREATLFLAVFDTPEEARSALRKYKDDRSEKSGTHAALRNGSGFDTVDGRGCISRTVHHCTHGPLSCRCCRLCTRA